MVKNLGQYVPREVEKIVKMVRLSLYNQELFCGDQAILWELDELGVSPRPSLGCNAKLTSGELISNALWEAQNLIYCKFSQNASVSAV